MAEADLILNNVDGMLEYETQIFLDIVQKDGLIIAAKGLCLNNVLVNIFKVYADAGNLVLVLNSSEPEERYFTARLESGTCHTTTYNTGTEDREDLYLSGGIHFVTTRILVVDLLKKRLPIEKITGIVVLNAHKVLESGQEAFVLRLYRQNNKTGFVKAFSNDSQSFTYGFGHLERVMRNLFVKEVHIWPRFHSTVIQTLKQREPHLIELHVPITGHIDRIQTCLLELINRLIKEIKLMNKTVEIQEMTVENCLLKKFYKILQSQLDPIWNQLSSNSKQLIAELKTLHHVLSTLFHSDCVSFYAWVRSFQSAEYVARATWPYYAEADAFFAAAKARVLSKQDELDPEYSPKWKSLFEILNTEIPADLNSSNMQQTHKSVLILCQDRKTCYQLNQFLRCGPRHYLFLMALQKDIKFKKISDSFNNCKAIRALDVCDQKPDDIKLKISRAKKPRLTKQEKADKDDSEKDKTEEDIDDGEDLRNIYCLSMSEPALTVDDANASVHENSQYVFESLQEVENMPLTQLCDITKESSALTVIIRTFRECGNVATLPETLQQLQPNYIIMYHTNVTAIRQIEIFEARKTKSDTKSKIYFLVHAGTVEEQCYLTALRREKQAFEHLIETKSTMVVPEDQDGRSDICDALLVTLPDAAGVEMAGGSTRRGGAPQSALAPYERCVIVDMREFRSELPALLHRRGLRIEPLTITIGDYILTPDICVERKSVSDLVGSLNSGRLYQQCTQMGRFYTKPMLLIEFDQNKPFSWESQYMISSDGNSFDIQKKLLLLTMHFPKLKIIWSPNPYATAALFEELKNGKEEPNAEYAVAAKADGEGTEVQESLYNSTLYDFVRKLPGINSKNISALLKKYKNLMELCRASEVELKDVLGTSADANSLFSILHEEVVSEDGKTAVKTKQTAKNKFKYARKQN